jgi:hypothetical protein
MPMIERRRGALSSIPGTAEALTTDVHGVLSAAVASVQDGWGGRLLAWLALGQSPVKVAERTLVDRSGGLVV